MSIAQQVFHLQELDTSIEADRQNLHHLTCQLGETQAMIKLRAEFDGLQKHLEEIKKQQQSLQWEDDDISSKLNKLENDLYSGRISNPKELTNLEQDIGMLKANRNKIDDKILALMDEVESVTEQVASLGDQYKNMEADWKVDQQKLAGDIEQLKAVLAQEEQEKLTLVDGIDPQIIELYNDLKLKRKTAVAKVTQGVCSGCRIQLPSTDLQRVRSGSVVQCSSCSRILYQP